MTIEEENTGIIFIYLVFHFDVKILILLCGKGH